MEETTEVINNIEPLLELGVMLGQRRSFSMIAGRCSAAQAECLRRIHENKTYTQLGQTWDEFCEQRLKISRRTADRLIRLLKEFGPLYFEATSVTGIAPAAYRRIAKSIDADCIHVGGDVIALIPANTDRAIEAVAQLQAQAESEAAGEAESAVPEQIRALERRGRQLAEAFRKVGRGAGELERQWLNGAVRRVANEIARIEAQAL